MTKTKYFDFKGKVSEEELEICANIIKNGGTVVFPTETIYGIGANALSNTAVNKIFEAKGRPNDNPLIVHISDKKQIDKLVEEVSDIEQKLIDAFMPGPFTLILKKKQIIPDNVTAGLETVGIRMPDNEVATSLIELAGIPIAAPSANISGRPSGTRIEDIMLELDGKVDAIIDSGNSEIGLESTVVKVIEGTPTILRPGKITLEEIQRIIGAGELSDKLFKKAEDKEKVESPGMKHRHYAPNTKCVLIGAGSIFEQIDKINKIIETEQNAYVLGFDEYTDKINSKNFISLGSINNLEEISKNLFSLLREVDSKNTDLIVIAGVEKEGLGIAIMNRLIRACEYNEV